MSRRYDRPLPAQDTSTTCTGNRDATNSPAGMYTAIQIPVGGSKVDFVDLMFGNDDINQYGEVTYSQSLKGCTFDHDATPPICKGDADEKGTTFKYGRFVEPPTKDIGSMFIPVAKFANDPAQKPLTRFEKLIDNTLIIQWCPTENHFKVLIDTHIPFTKPAGPFFLRYAGPLPTAD